MKNKVAQIQDNARLIDGIADCLIEDHIELMNENASFRARIETLEASLRELLDEYHPREQWSDETIEYEIQEGNMGAPMVKRAYAALEQPEPRNQCGETCERAKLCPCVLVGWSSRSRSG